MDLEQLQKNYDDLKIKYDELIEENKQLKEHLKKYTAPERKKKYYQAHKETIKNKVRQYQKEKDYKPQISAEKRKEYNKRAYEKRKKKIININYDLSASKNT